MVLRALTQHLGSALWTRVLLAGEARLMGNPGAALGAHADPPTAQVLGMIRLSSVPAAGSP
jgi:hypothetical protein